jgi:hypothetical protein
MMKKHHLVVYDYGSGGVWAIINARCEAEIIQKYPALAILQSRPLWMTDENYKEVASNRTFDIDDPPDEWLRRMTDPKA